MLWCSLRKSHIKHIVLLVTVLFVGIILIVAAQNRSDTRHVSSGCASAPTVIIDAGHGGFDGGTAASDGTLEKDLNLSVARQLVELCRIFGIRSIPTREDDCGLEADPSAAIRSRKISDMQARLAMMKRYNPAAFISIHMNYFDLSSVHGAQVFYSLNTTASKETAESIQKRLFDLDPSSNRAVKPATNAIYLLKNATCPAVLVECGFMSNPDDLRNLCDPIYRNRLSVSVLFGLLDKHSAQIRTRF